jgi:ribosomal protein L21E
MKYGGRDLESITTEAEKVMKGETAPEEVSDRQGDFYVVPIMMAGKQRELFFSPFHMAKISAFLKMTRDNGI